MEGQAELDRRTHTQPHTVMAVQANRHTDGRTSKHTGKHRKKLAGDGVNELEEVGEREGAIKEA